jgi:hypothetical protein
LKTPTTVAVDGSNVYVLVDGSSVLKITPK